MKAVCWQGKGQVHIDNVPDPKIINPRDCTSRKAFCCRCGTSDIARAIWIGVYVPFNGDRDHADDTAQSGVYVSRRVPGVSW